MACTWPEIWVLLLSFFFPVEDNINVFQTGTAPRNTRPDSPIFPPFEGCTSRPCGPPRHELWNSFPPLLWTSRAIALSVTTSPDNSTDLHCTSLVLGLQDLISASYFWSPFLLQDSLFSHFLFLLQLSPLEFPSPICKFLLELSLLELHCPICDLFPRFTKNVIKFLPH